jgi:hypothetical protein
MSMAAIEERGMVLWAVVRWGRRCLADGYYGMSPPLSGLNIPERFGLRGTACM